MDWSLLNRYINRKFVDSVYTHTEAHGGLYFAGYTDLQDIQNARRAYNEHTGRFIMFSVIINIYNKKTIGLTLMELFTATGKLEKFFFDN